MPGMGKNGSNGDDDDDGESLTEDDVQRIEKLLKSYTLAGRDGGSRDSDQSIVDTLRTELSQQFCLTCLICLERIGESSAVWNCRACRSAYHLQCAQLWANESVQKCFSNDENSFNERSDAKAHLKAIWCCPKCRLEYGRQEIPKEYLCFCGQAVNPAADLWLPPHSCGLMCKRLLTCNHVCLMLCHPGPCPPCPKIIENSCFCAKSAPKAFRCYAAKWSCRKTCQKTLLCGKHRCGLMCHEGDCEPCAESFARACMCGKRTAERPCAERAWWCDAPCRKILPCGKHHCAQKCHAGQCSPCAEANSLKCPCGKTSYESGDCIDDLKCCGDTCGKLLDCGLHTCVERCHRGPCGTCNQTLVKRCRCGAKEKEYPCGKELLCEIKCKNRRSCGKHACNRKCCPGYGSPDCSAPCEQSCLRGLQCGNHKCAQTCHTGPCYPCTLSAEVKCRCGATVIKVPCGRERHVKPPKCLKICQVATVCNHASREPHRCHCGQCPPCLQICQLALPCGHHCQQSCHKGLLVDVNEAQNKRKATTPWDNRRHVKLELVDEPCPPCQWPVPVRCLGDHVTEPTPCCRAGRPFDCGRPCRRTIDCGNHACTLKCHATTADAKKGHACEVCERKCELKRPDGCSHPCPLPCHPAPCPECRLMVKMLCHCKLNEKLVPCPEWRQADSEKRLQMSSCGNQCPKLMDCGHPCIFTCHLGNCSSTSDCKKRIQIKCRCGLKSSKIQCYQKTGYQGKMDCDSECEQAKKQRLEEISKNSAESLENPDLGSSFNHGKQQPQSQILLARRRRKKKQRGDSESENNSWFYQFKYCIFGGLVVFVGILMFYAVRLSGQ